MGKPPRRLTSSGFSRTLVVALAVSAILAVLCPWRLPLSSDGLLSLRTAFSLAFTGSFRLPMAGPRASLDPFTFLRASGPIPGVVSIYSPLGPLLDAALLRPLEKLPLGPHRGAAADFLLECIPILCAAAAVFPLSRLARYGGASSQVSPLLAGGLIVATFLGPLGVSDFQEPVLVLLTVSAFERALRARRLRSARRRKNLVLSGALLSVSLLAKPTALVILPGLFIGAFLRRRRGEALHVGSFFLGFLPGLAVFLFLNAVRFGSPFVVGYGRLLENPLARRVGLLWTLIRLTVLPNRGVLWFAPLVLLAFLSGRVGWRGFRRVDRLASITAAGALFGTNLFWWAWEGGFCWGPRLLAPAVALALPCLAGRGRRFVKEATILAAAGFILNLSGFLLDYGRIYDVVASRPSAQPPWGPIAPIHQDARSPDGLYPLQRVHYVPADACWLIAPRILARLLVEGESPVTGAKRGQDRNDALLLRALSGRRLLPSSSSVGQTLLEEAYVSADIEPPRSLRMALLSLSFGGPPVDGRALASALLLRSGRKGEAARLCREGLALDPARADLRTNLALAEAGTP